MFEAFKRPVTDCFYNRLCRVTFLGHSVIDLFAILKKECGSNDISLHFIEFSNVHNCDRSSDTIQSNLGYRNVLKILLDPGSFVE